MRRFATGKYGRQKLEFFPAPFKAPLRAFASLVFPWHEGKVVVCHICDRGWCIPSGRVEPHETSREAAAREAIEEAGILLEEPQYIGCYRISDRDEVRWADVYTARVKELVDITMPNESLGRRIVGLEDLPTIYHLWNELTSQMFEFSREVLVRREQCGGY